MGAITREKLLELAGAAGFPPEALEHCKTTTAVAIGACAATPDGAGHPHWKPDLSAENEVLCPLSAVDRFQDQAGRALAFDQLAEGAFGSLEDNHYFEVID